MKEMDISEEAYKNGYEKGKADANKKTVTQRLEEIASEMCDNYCKFPNLLKDYEKLMEKCENCPLNFLVGG